MKRIRAIVRKDLLHLWPQILLLWAAIALAAINDPLGDPHGSGISSGLLSLVQPLACWLLVISVVQSERLTGEEAYWLTRPFSWKNLLAAKALFVVTFVNLPLLILQCCTLASLDMSPLQWSWALLWRQVFFSIYFILPAAAVAAATRNLGEAMLMGVLILGAVWAEGMLLLSTNFQTWGSAAWVRNSIAFLTVAAGTVTVLWMQYSRRATIWSRGLLGVTAFVAIYASLMPLWGAAVKLQHLVGDEPVSANEVRISFDPSRDGQWPQRWGTNSNDPPGRRAEIPVRILNVPEGARLGLDWYRVRAKSARGEWESGWRTQQALHIDASDSAWVTLFLDPKFAGAPTDVEVTLELTLSRRGRVINMPQGPPVYVDGVGICGWPIGSNPGCYTPFQRTLVVFTTHAPEPGDLALPNAPYGPIPTSASFRPFDRAFEWSGGPQPGPILLVIEHPVAHFERNFTARITNWH